MKTVTGKVISSKPISLSKAASTLSPFLSTDNGASQALCAYLKRASASFNELKQTAVRQNLRHPRADGRSDGRGAMGMARGARMRGQMAERRKDGKTTMASGGSADFEDVVDRKRKGGELKIEAVVEMDVDSNDRDKSTLAVEKRIKKHKKKSKGGDDDSEAGARKSDSKLRISDDNGIENNRGLKIEATGDLVEKNVARGKDRRKHEDAKRRKGNA